MKNEEWGIWNGAVLGVNGPWTPKKDTQKVAK